MATTGVAPWTPMEPAFRSGTLIRPSATYTIVWYRTPAQRGITSSSMSNGWPNERSIASRSFALNPDPVAAR